MKKEIIINATSTEIRVAITEDDRLAEIFLEVPDKERHVGSIYLGRVERVVQGMNAAFVSIGETQDAFLHFSDVGSAMDEFKDLLDEKDDDEDDDDEETTETSDKKGDARGRNPRGRKDEPRKDEARAETREGVVPPPASPAADNKVQRDDRGRDNRNSRDRDRDRSPRKDRPESRADEDQPTTATDAQPPQTEGERENRTGDRRQGRDDRRGGRDRRDGNRDGNRDRGEARTEREDAPQPESPRDRTPQEQPAEENRGRDNRRGGDRRDQNRRDTPVKEPVDAEQEELPEIDADGETDDTIVGGTPEQQEEQRKRRRKRGRRGGRGRNRRREGEEEGQSGEGNGPEGEANEATATEGTTTEARRDDDRPARDDRRRDDRPVRDDRDRENRQERDDRPARDDRRQDDRPARDDRDRENRQERDDRPRDDRRQDDRPARDDRDRENRQERDDRPAREERPARDERGRDERPERDNRRRDDRPQPESRQRDDRPERGTVERGTDERDGGDRHDREETGNLSSEQRRNERGRDKERERYRQEDRGTDEQRQEHRDAAQERREQEEQTASGNRPQESEGAGEEQREGRRNNRRGGRRDRPRGERRDRPEGTTQEGTLSHEESYRPGTGGDEPRGEMIDRREEPRSGREEIAPKPEMPREEAPAGKPKSPRRERPARGQKNVSEGSATAEPRLETTERPRAEAIETPGPTAQPPESGAETPARPRRPHRRGGKRGGEGTSDAPVKGPTVDAKLPTFQTKRSGEVTIALEKGQDVIVQVTRESYASKGVRVTTKVSLPGRFLVLLPLDPSIGISRKVQLMKERRRLRRIAKSILPEGYGCIIRTVAQDKDEEVIKQDLTMLIDNWRAVEQKIKQTNGPSLLYKDQSIANTVMRDLFTPDTNRVVIDNKALYKEIRDYVAWAAPQLVEKVEHYTGAKPIFDQFGVERELHKISERRTYIPSGGYIILDQTEAMMVIDVNSGRYAGKKDQELNSLRTNLESAREIARQIRLRDIGGLIVVDFIDLYDEKNRKKVYDELKREMKKDRAKSVVLPMTQFGLVQMTRQRIRQQVVQTISEPCPVCAGSGLVQSKSTVIRNIERWLSRFKEASREFRLTLTANPTIIDYLTEGSPSRLTKLMLKYFVRVKVVLDESLPVDEFHFFSLRQQADITDKYINEPKVKEKDRDRDKERERRDAREIREVEMS